MKIRLPALLLLMNLLMMQGLKADVDTEKLMNWLTSATEKNQLKIIAKLKATGVGTWPTHEDKLEAWLLEAAQQGCLDEVKNLVEAGVNVNVRESTEGKSPLHIAALAGNDHLVEYLLTVEGVEIDAVTAVNDATALHLAVWEDHKNTVRKLLAAQVNVNCKAGDGNTPVHLAAALGYCDILTMLLSVEYMVVELDNILTRKDFLGYTPLHLAVYSGNIAIVRALKNAGASQSIEDGKGMTPLQLAQKKRHLSVVELLSK